MGPGQLPQYTRALHGGEAVGGSSQQHSTSQSEPKLRHGSGAQVDSSVPQSLKSDSQDAQEMRRCVSVSSGVAAATSKTLVEGSQSRSCKSRKSVWSYNVDAFRSGGANGPGIV